MVEDWVTILVLAFGIIVAVVGVIAYLRLYRREKEDTESQSISDHSPSDANSLPSSTRVGGDETITGHGSNED